MIAKSGKAHTIGEQLLLRVVKEVLRTVVHAPVEVIAKKIPLSNDTVQRRIDVMAKEVEDTLCSLLRNREFSLVLNESTLPGNETILLSYVRFIKDEHLMQEILFAKELKTDAKVPLRSILRSDKIKVPFDKRPGVIYEIKCCWNASYIGETGNNLLHRFREHLACLTRYKNAERRLNGSQARHRGRSQCRAPQKIMEEGLKASAVTEHAIHCSDDLRPQIICHESNVHLRRIKESLFIRNNCTINRDRGVEVSEVWNAAIKKTRCSTRPS
uniref:GIY-YIG domain-containing protein n=1 Tax=Trichuris muris TaxID=70415 RepID=A0A5S6QBN7_TRIMR